MPLRGKGEIMTGTAVKEKVREKVREKRTRNVPAKRNSSPVEDELSSLAAQNKELEDAERAKTGGQNSFITLVQGNSGILLPDDSAYIKGVKLHDYAISSKKLRLGPTLNITILGMFKLFAEVAKKEKETDMDTTVQFWMPEDAEQVPVQGIFERPLPNGNILKPVHWVYVYLHDYPDIEDGLIAFRSVGNRVYTALAKLIKSESSICTELRFTVTKQAIKNDTYKTTNYYPKFEISGRNFKLDENRKVLPVKGGLKADEIKEIFMRSNKAQSDYASCKLVARKTNLAGLLAAPKALAALPAGRDGYQEESDDGEELSF
jgi:hypothetical protein